MNISISIILKYNNDEKELPNIMIDLYKFYNCNFCRKSKNYIFTDINKNENIINISHAYLKGIVNGDITQLLNIIKKDNDTKLISYSNKTDLIQKIYKILEKNRIKNLMFYYTGHGERGYILLPDNDKIFYDEINNLLLIPKIKNILLIIDCCYSIKFNLPFVYENKWILYDNNYNIKNNILNINSCDNDNVSELKSTGSTFSNYIFDYINLNYSIEKIYELIPNIRILSSIPEDNNIKFFSKKNFILEEDFFLENFNIIKNE